MGEYRCFEISLFAGIDSRHFSDIFSRFLYHNVHGVIECDNTDHQPVRIQDRDGEKIIFCEKLCYFFFICMCFYRDDLSLHEIPDQNIIVCGHQVFGADDTGQSAPFSHIAGIDCFFVYPCFLDMCHRLCDSHIFPDVYVFCSHNASGTVFRIVQELIDERPV